LWKYPLAIEADRREPRTVTDGLKDLRTVHRKGIISEAGPYPVKSWTASGWTAGKLSSSTFPVSALTAVSS
jgi:hypothetical protein